MMCDWPDAVRKLKPFCETSFVPPIIEIGGWKTDPVTTMKPKNVTLPMKLSEMTTKKPYKGKPYLTTCDPAIPHIEHPYSCYKFLHCVPDSEEGYYYVEKTCNPPTMYHPISMVCEWPETVKSVKPKCGTLPEEPEPDWETQESVIIEETILTKKKKHKKILPGGVVEEEYCEDGFIWSECAYPCGKACKYYKHLLYENGFCQRDSNECVPDCIPVSSAEDCRPKLWRDSQTCVEIADCTCVTENNQPIKVSNLDILNIFLREFKNFSLEKLLKSRNVKFVSV